MKYDGARCRSRGKEGFVKHEAAICWSVFMETDCFRTLAEARVQGNIPRKPKFSCWGNKIWWHSRWWAMKWEGSFSPCLHQHKSGTAPLCPGSWRLPPEAKDQTQPWTVIVLLALWECFQICALLYCSRTSYKRPLLKRIILIMGEKNPLSLSPQKDRLHWDYQGKMTIQTYSSYSWNKEGVAQVIVGLNHCKKTSGLRFHSSQPQNPLPPTG